MEYLGGFNVFTSHFIIGCKEVQREFTKTETKEIKALHSWLYFKDNDWGMWKYRSDKTQYIDFLEIIELEQFKKITEQLYQIYFKEYPFSTRQDFIDFVFQYTIYDLERFLTLNLICMGNAPNELHYTFYTVYIFDEREFLDFAIDSRYDIEHYRQYYKRVLSYLKSFAEEQELIPQQLNNDVSVDLKITAIHYVLTYIFDCYATGKSLPNGKKNEIEKIGNDILGLGRGNTFYKNYNKVIHKDLNVEQNLIDKGGENWREILLKLSKNKKELEIYLQNKHL